tara:strand:- start:1089 stop:1283 length:195 start_codon:yes stop_codon:yes gene_type:complete
VLFLLAENFVVGPTDISNQKVEEDHCNKDCDEEPEEPSDEQHQRIVSVILEIQITTMNGLRKLI